MSETFGQKCPTENQKIQHSPVNVKTETRNVLI